MEFEALAPRTELADDETDRFHVVTPGEVVTSDSNYMRGHGTYSEGEKLIASVAGLIERVNKLISVKPMRARFTGEIGDVVVGRITELGPKRWKVDINSRQEAILLLSSINLPGGVQRRKSESDELQMQNFFREGHLLSAEIQQFFQDGAASLQTRNVKYGKLRNGSLVVVQPGLIKRSKSHFAHLPSCGVDVILGLNGYIWVSKHVELSPDLANQPEGLYSDENEEISPTLRENIARVCNCISALSNAQCFINDTIIQYAYEASLEFEAKDLLKEGIQLQVVATAKEMVRDAMQL
ncbi:hypothetical protein BJ742DRAFT_673647 [Cladochytrium replicatum]|nr:hypothetical protein BJ742DRAFT_673647 [Cladochytrium replicatum]